MQVLYDHQIFSSQPSGGVSRYFAELIKASDSTASPATTAWDYTANAYLHDYNPRRFHDWLPRLRFKGKAHLTGWMNQRTSLGALQGMWDIFHPTYYDPYFLPYLQGRPFVLTIHDMTHELHPEGLSDAQTTPQRKALLAQCAAKIIAVSENTRQDAIRLLNVEPDKVITIHHGNSLNPALISPSPAPRSDYWLYVGTRSAYKNWSLVVQALRSRQDSGDSLVMIGGGTLTMTERQELDVAVPGRYWQASTTEAQLAGWYQAARALVYPSRYEGFGMPLVEAMSWGCPVVASRASCLPEIGGPAALYFEPTSVQDLCERLLQVTQPSVRAHLVDQGLARSSGFTWNKAVEQTLSVYQGLL